MYYFDFVSYDIFYDVPLKNLWSYIIGSLYT